MRSFRVRFPYFYKNKKTQSLMRTYSEFVGNEMNVLEGERQRFQTARLFELQNQKGEKYLFRVKGNGVYELHKTSLNRNAPIATGTMMDSVPPEIIPL